MLTEEKLIDICEAAEITPFRAVVSYRESDTLLLSEDIEGLIELCQINDISCLFYSYTFPEIENYRIDTDAVVDSLRKIHENYILRNGYRFRLLSFGDFSASILNETIKEVIVAAQNQNDKLCNITEDEPDCFQAWICLNGCKVFLISLRESNGSDTECESLTAKSDFYHFYRRNFETSLDNCLSSAIEEERILAEKNSLKRQAVLHEIELFLMADIELMTLKTKTARSSYADKLRHHWEEKANLSFTQKEIKDLVEKIYYKKATIT